MSDSPIDTPDQQQNDRWAVIHKFRTIGDAIFHMHAIHAIAAVAPRCRITLAMPGPIPAADLFVDDPAIEKVIFISRNAYFKGRIKNISILKQEHFRRVWILGESTSYAFTALFAGVKERLGYGYSLAQRTALTHHLQRPMPWPIPVGVAEASWAFLDTYGIARLPNGQKPVFSPERLQQAYQQYVSLPRPWISFGIGAREARRLWPNTHWCSLAEGLLQQWGPGTLFLCGGEQDRDKARYITDFLGKKSTVVHVIGNPLSVVASIFQHTNVFIGNDSGLFNLAGAIGSCPVIGLFGASPVLTYLPHALFVVPPDGAISSMQALTPAYVLQKVLQYCQSV
ncbi:MAG: hypothetical protein LBD15_02545 [Holosporales bacterium]|nr:hypothetical protein [Holosporales bacterium]